VTCVSDTRVESAPLPLPRGTLVEDADGRRGLLVGALLERDRARGRVVRRTAFLRPVGGGYEWTAAFEDIRAVGGDGLDDAR
jgi:hypothetical protein